ncbi:hypothetical protein AB0M87_32395 [Streptomyces sp. NPDC051320]
MRARLSATHRACGALRKRLLDAGGSSGSRGAGLGGWWAASLVLHSW